MASVYVWVYHLVLAVKGLNSIYLLTIGFHEQCIILFENVLVLWNIYIYILIVQVISDSQQCVLYLKPKVRLPTLKLYSAALCCYNSSLWERNAAYNLLEITIEFHLLLLPKSLEQFQHQTLYIKPGKHYPLAK